MRRLTRTVVVATGNMLQMLGHNSWKYIDDVEAYGPLSKVHGFFGVGSFIVAKVLY